MEDSIFLQLYDPPASHASGLWVRDFSEREGQRLDCDPSSYCLCNLFYAKAKLDYGIADKETGRKDCKQALLSFVLDEKEWVIACERFRDWVSVYSPAQEQTRTSEGLNVSICESWK